MELIGMFMMFAGADVPEGYARGGTSLPCSEYRELCEVLGPRFVHNGMATLPKCKYVFGRFIPAPSDVLANPVMDACIVNVR